MKKMKVGMLVQLPVGGNLEDELREVHELGFSLLQLGIREIELMRSESFAQHTAALLKKYGITLTQIRARWRAPAVWDLFDGPSTLGIVPSAYRAARTDDILASALFARRLDCNVISTHLGFIPTDPRSQDYVGVVQAMKAICAELARHGQVFMAETGQEPPNVLRRLIEDVKMDNLQVNYDPANLITCGMANPIDGLDLLGEFTKEVHAKDGVYPINGQVAGLQMPVGKGAVNFPAFLKRLRQFGFEGVLCIEWERDMWNQVVVPPEQRRKEIVEAKVYLEELCETM